MSPGSSTESYPAFARIGLRENPGKNLNQVTCPDRDSNPGHLVSRPDALTNVFRNKLRVRRAERDSLIESAAHRSANSFRVETKLSPSRQQKIHLILGNIARRGCVLINIDSRNVINLVDKFRATECTERKKSVIWPTKVTEDVVEDARERMQRGPNKSVKKLAVEIGVSYGSAHKFLRNKLDGRTSAECEQRCQAPNTRSAAVVERVRNLVMADRRLTVREIAKRLE
ncbi:hypothetical protein ANN_16622 [Periplaneta americana]|uniref:Uncharacterized protein n=1 Tax=Periplaneta americana TaxID=6978 RepID=A0ABQ8SQW2_PERAM|nr:hypothetical protein ANN_16622 [Periplaneta americana]